MSLSTRNRLQLERYLVVFLRREDRTLKSLFTYGPTSAPTMPLAIDASNACVPITSPLIHLSPPLPTTTRGEPTFLDGNPGRFNADLSLIVYGSGRLVVVREIHNDQDGKTASKTFVYRGHTATVTCARFSPSGCYVASGDVRGKLRVWSWDNEEHLCKLDLNVLTGPIRCLAWDFESKRVSSSPQYFKYL